MKKRDAIRKLALELSYLATGSDHLPQLWTALQRTDPALAAAINEAWWRHKPCFYWWMQGKPDVVIDSTKCECRGACDKVPVAA